MAKTKRKKIKRPDLSFGGSKKKHPISATREKTLRSDSIYLKLVKERVDNGKGIIDIPNMLISMNRVNPRLTATKIGEIEAGLKRMNFLIKKEAADRLIADELAYVPPAPYNPSGSRGTREPILIIKKGSAFPQLIKDVESILPNNIKKSIKKSKKSKKSRNSRNSNKSKLGGARLPARSNRSHILRSDRETLNLAKERFDKQLGPFDIENELFKIMRNDPDLDEDELFKKYKEFERINFLIRKLEDEHSKEGK